MTAAYDAAADQRAIQRKAQWGGGTDWIGLHLIQAEISVAAPILFVALGIQGVADGGERSGCVLMIAEDVESRRRGFYAGMGHRGLSAAAVFAVVIIALVTALPEDQLSSWGWRLPFGIGFALVAIDIFLQLQIIESPLVVEADKPRPQGRLLPAGGHLPSPRRGITVSVPHTMSEASSETSAVVVRGVGPSDGAARPRVDLGSVVLHDPSIWAAFRQTWSTTPNRTWDSQRGHPEVSAHARDVEPLAASSLLADYPHSSLRRRRAGRRLCSGYCSSPSHGSLVRSRLS